VAARWPLIVTYRERFLVNTLSPATSILTFQASINEEIKVMTTQLNLADLLFLQAQVIKGPFNPPGSDTLSLLGTRTIDGTQNNLTHTNIVDQYGRTVFTDTFAVVDQPFFYFAGADPLAQAGFNADGTNRLINSGGDIFYRGITYDSGTQTATTTLINYTPTPGSPLTVINDESPRLISNIVADMSANNPATATADIIGNEGNLTLNILPTNALFTFFGQFFDHGVDFINKGGTGTVIGDHLILSRASLDVNGDVINSTAPLVEQSQTYGQRATTTFYLMEYSDGTDSDGLGNILPIGAPTGRLVTHADGGMATWQDIKDNAALKGIILTDADVLNVPEPIAPVGGGLTGYTKGPGTGQAFLADIAHFAVPVDQLGNPLTEDVDGDIGNLPGAGFYDDELLDAHKVAGDARVNENIALTAIHEAFHGEHNRLVLQIQDLIKQQDLITPGFADQWDGARIFDAAKLVNEMQYQHFVFEEFARRLSPNIDAFAQYDVTINPNISLEFSQAVFRLGHSMLTDQVNAVGADGVVDSMTLVQAFLNPQAFDAAGSAALIEGQTRQEMNQIDEFVVDSVRNLLLGVELDLAAINIARARDVNLPTLNQTRQDLFLQTGGQVASLTPYASWTEFGANLLHPESLVNFIAAYARGGTALGDAIVAARETLVEVQNNPASTAQDIANAQAALRSAAAAAMADGTFMSAAGNQGFWDIDLWIGGLAEAKVPPNLLAPTSVGMLGSTFDFIFATQLKSLQDGDRLYYLARLGGTNILDEIEGKKFGELFERGTGATHTNGDIFGVANEYIELSSTPGLHAFTTTHALNDPWAEVVGGTTLADTFNTGSGNDTVWGEDGNDIINTGAGADHIFGGDGIDIIDAGDNNDFVRGDSGNDQINGGAGDDIIFAGDGNDIINAGEGFDEVFGGQGNDTISGGNQDDALFGMDHDDVISGGLGNDELGGDAGDDVLRGDQGADTLIGGEDNNVMIGGAGADTFDGLLGLYDLVAYDTPTGPGTVGLTIDMTGATSTGDALGDVFGIVAGTIEEVRGTGKNDIIIGDPGFNNILSGGGGSDTLIGGGADDTLYSNGLGTDSLVGGAGIDLGVWLGAEWDNPLTVIDERSPGYAGPAVTFTVSSVGDGTVTVGGVVDTLTGVETLSFDNGIWSVVSNEWVPLIGVTDSITDVIEGGAVDFEIDGNLVNVNVMLDNTLIPLTGIRVGDVDILDPDGPNGVRTVTLAGEDAASFALFDVFNPLTNESYQELRFVGGRPVGAGAATNYEVQPHYHVTLNVADGSGGSAINYTLNITDVNDNAPLITSPDQIHVTDGSGTNTVVYRITATDRDTQGAIADPTQVGGSVQGPLTYTLAPDGPGNDNVLFTLSDNGEIRFDPPGPVFTPGGDNVKTLVVQASDGAFTTVKTVEVVIEPVGAPPPDPGTIIESDGQFILRNVGSEYVIDPEGAGSNVNVTFQGAQVGPNSFAGWTAIQAEDDVVNGGFDVLWEHTNGDWSLWNLDANGALQSFVFTPVAGQPAVVFGYELTFEADLNGDNVVGSPLTIVEALGGSTPNGAITLSLVGAQYHVGDGVLPETGVTYLGGAAGPGTFAGWTAIQAEDDPVNGGFDVLWEHTNGDWSFWNIDANGAYQSHEYTPAPLPPALVTEYQATFGF
jgi:Ca2+-binding RTX toxin-like protein